MIDVHCHLTDRRYKSEEELAAVIRQAREEGVWMITNGTGVEDSKLAVNLAERETAIWACVGLAYEPGYTNLEEIEGELIKLGSNLKVVGIGESGLDFFPGIPDNLKQYQLNLFKMHLKLASKLDLPIQIHNRGADKEIFQCLASAIERDKVHVLLHCFSGSFEFMKQMDELGCYFSFGGMLTYKKNEWLRELVKSIPETKLLLETDAPYLPPDSLRGQNNQPANVKIIAEVIARIRGVDLQKFEQQTQDNTLNLFKKMK